MQAIPRAQDCCVECEAPVRVSLPGAAGANVAGGHEGVSGSSAFTTTTDVFIMPGSLGSVTVLVGDSRWMSVGQTVFLSAAGFMSVLAIPSDTSVTLKNLAQGVLYAENAAAGATIASGNTVSPAGPQGPSGTAYYKHVQNVAATIWTVVHNLGKIPSVTLVVDGFMGYGLCEVVDDNTLVLTFDEALVGSATCT